MRRTALHREVVGMARYKPMHKGLKLLPVDFDQQVIPGSFEHALCHLVDHELDLAEFHARRAPKGSSLAIRH